MAEPTVFAEVNYTGAMNARPQFHANDKSLDRVALDPRVVPIRDARREAAPPTLAREGIELFQCKTAVADFRDTEAVGKIYPDEIQQFMLELTGADAVAVTGPPILRFGERSPEAGTRDHSYAARRVHLRHIDATAA